MWERFCYYGMRALLVLYVAKHLAQPGIIETVPGFIAVQAGLERIFGHLDNEQLADQIYGLYTAFVYLTPLFGGILADRYLGQRKSVIIGGVIMALGEFMMMKDSLFFPAMIALCVGCGLFKSNVSTQVGGLYAKGAPAPRPRVQRLLRRHQPGGVALPDRVRHARPERGRRGQPTLVVGFRLGRCGDDGRPRHLPLGAALSGP